MIWEDILKIASTYEETDWCTTLLGEDDTSSSYPPHKVIRIIANMLLRLSVMKMAALWLLAAYLAATLTALHLSLFFRITASLFLFLVLAFISPFVFAGWLTKSTETAYLYWVHHKTRRDFTAWQLTRIVHVFNSTALSGLGFQVMVQISALIFCGLLLFQGLAWGVAAVPLLMFFWRIVRQVGINASYTYFETLASVHGDDSARVADTVADIGGLPGDRTKRSCTLKSLATGRRLRLPSMRLSVPLAYMTGVSWLALLLFVFSPIVFFAMWSHSWLRYTPIPQLAILAAIWPAAALIRVFKVRDSRQFQTILLRPFSWAPSEYAKNAVLPVLGSIGCGVTVEDRTFTSARVRDMPFSVSLSVISDLRSMIPYIVGKDWKHEVEALISESDAAVIDVTTVTEDIAWEIKCCLRHLPPSRVLFITLASPPEERLRQDKALRSALGDFELASTSQVILYKPRFVGRLAFKWKLLRVFKKIRSLG